jgi:glutamate racemase
MIGIFDSGVGGMSVMRAVVQALPREDIAYIADSANCPYGSRMPQEIVMLSQRIVDFLLAKKCSIIVIACNTATAAAIDYLRSAYSRVDFVGMQPAVKPAAAMSVSKKIAVLATRGTIAGRLFRESMQEYAASAEFQVIAGEGLVELVEQGMEDSPQAACVLQNLLQPALDKGIDTIVLGCTHYPFLSAAIARIAGGVRIVDAAMPVAMQTKRLLHGRSISVSCGMPSYSFYTSGDTAILKQMQERHLRLPNVSYEKFYAQ